MPLIHIGTSGWHYDHWIGPFYSEGTKPDAFLPYYAEHFACVEINNTSYRLPERDMLARWRDATPEDFRFAG